MERHTVRKVLVIGALLLAGLLAWKAVSGFFVGMFVLAMKFMLPLAIVAVIGVIAYRSLTKDRALGDSRRGRLPRL